MKSRCHVVFVATCTGAFFLGGCTAASTNAGSAMTRGTFNSAPTTSMPVSPTTATPETTPPAETSSAPPASIIVFERPVTYTVARTETAHIEPTREIRDSATTLPTPVITTPVATRTAAPAQTHPAALALLNEATRQEKSGELELAAAKLERALKIEPRSAFLWHKLANVRLRQGQHQLAASLAEKSNSYAASDVELVDLNQRIIARANSR